MYDSLIMLFIIGGLLYSFNKDIQKNFNVISVIGLSSLFFFSQSPLNAEVSEDTFLGIENPNIILVKSNNTFNNSNNFDSLDFENELENSIFECQSQAVINQLRGGESNNPKPVAFLPNSHRPKINKPNGTPKPTISDPQPPKYRPGGGGGSGGGDGGYSNGFTSSQQSAVPPQISGTPILTFTALMKITRKRKIHLKDEIHGNVDLKLYNLE
jgi:hypothetical protein